MFSFSTSAGPYWAPGTKRFSEYGNRTAYQILGLPQFTDHATCKATYRKGAGKLLGLVNGGDKVAEAKLAALNTAWNYLDKIERERHLDEMEATEKEASKVSTATPIDDSDFADLFEDAVNANMAAQQFASQQQWKSSYESSMAYTSKLGLRENQLMELVDSLVDRRMNKLIDQTAVDKVVSFFNARYGVDVEAIAVLIRNNLFRDLASELLVRAACKYYLTKFGKDGRILVQGLYGRLEYEKSTRIESVLTSQQMRAEFDLLLKLSYALSETSVEFDPHPKTSPFKMNICERIFTR